MGELNLSGILIGSEQPEVLGEFYERILERPPDMKEDVFFGWRIGAGFLSVIPHSEVKGRAGEPQRLMFNFETANVKEEFDRIKAAGATVVAEPYDFEDRGMWIATFADPDGNFFQLVTPFEEGGTS